jgi:hypothetical protein
VKHRPIWLIVALVTAATVVVSAAGEIRITPISSDGHVLVSFSAPDAWTLGSREVLQSSLQLRYEYVVELRQARPLWFFDATLARADVSALARMDSLKGRFDVKRMRSGSIFQSEQRAKESEVRDWLTQWDQVSLDPVTPLEPNAEYYVSVVLTIRPKRSVSLISLLPFGKDENSGRKSFIFLK